MGKLNLKDLMQELNYKDLRAVRNWCKKNGILIIIAGKAEYVIEANYKQVIEKPFIEKLKSEFGAEWESVYQLYSSGNIAALSTLQELPDSNFKTYKPKDPIAKKYQNQLAHYAQR